MEDIEFSSSDGTEWWIQLDEPDSGGRVYICAFPPDNEDYEEYFEVPSFSQADARKLVDALVTLIDAAEAATSGGMRADRLEFVSDDGEDVYCVQGRSDNSIVISADAPGSEEDDHSELPAFDIPTAHKLLGAVRDTIDAANGVPALPRAATVSGPETGGAYGATAPKDWNDDLEIIARALTKRAFSFFLWVGVIPPTVFIAWQAFTVREFTAGGFAIGTAVVLGWVLSMTVLMLVAIKFLPPRRRHPVLRLIRRRNDEIVWFHTHRLITSGGSSWSLVLRLANGRKRKAGLMLDTFNDDDMETRVLDAVARLCPHATRGYSEDRERRYKADPLSLSSASRLEEKRSGGSAIPRVFGLAVVICAIWWQMASGEKRGFEVPIGAWLRGPLRPALLDLLSWETITRQGLLQPQSVGRLVDYHLGERDDHGRGLWALVVLSAWLDSGVTG